MLGRCTFPVRSILIVQLRDLSGRAGAIGRQHWVWPIQPVRCSANRVASLRLAVMYFQVGDDVAPVDFLKIDPSPTSVEVEDHLIVVVGNISGMLAIPVQLAYRQR